MVLLGANGFMEVGHPRVSEASGFGGQDPSEDIWYDTAGLWIRLRSPDAMAWLLSVGWGYIWRTCRTFL